MDVGLSDFNDLLAGDNPTDIDAESGGYSAKLDLARAYIEIDDFDQRCKPLKMLLPMARGSARRSTTLKAKITSNK